jgi:hypothetical protein
MFKQGTEENVVLCTTLGPKAEESHGRSKEIIETKPEDEDPTAGHLYQGQCRLNRRSPTA